jgi:hypothetical protein
MKKLIFGVVVAVVVAGTVVWLGLFPVARLPAGKAGVAGGFVWYRDVTTFENASAHFRELAKQKDPAFPDGDSPSDRRRAYLQELVVRRIVDSGLAELDANSFSGEIASTIEQAKAGKDLAKLAEATANLYGLSFAEFQSLVLEPQAREITLRKHIEASGKVYGDWLTARAKNTAVAIYFLPYKWQDGALVNK